MRPDTADEGARMRMLCTPGSNSNQRDCGVTASFDGVVESFVAYRSAVFMASVPVVQSNTTRLPALNEY